MDLLLDLPKEVVVGDIDHPMEDLVEEADLLADLLEEATEEDLDHSVEEAMDRPVVGVLGPLDLDSDQDTLLEEEEVAVNRHIIHTHFHPRGLPD